MRKKKPNDPLGCLYGNNVCIRDLFWSPMMSWSLRGCTWISQKTKKPKRFWVMIDNAWTSICNNHLECFTPSGVILKKELLKKILNKNGK